MKKSNASDYTIVSLLVEGKESLGLSGEDLEKIILKCVIGEPEKSASESLDTYYTKRAEELRNKIYSAMREIEQKGKDHYLQKIQYQIERCIEKKGMVSGNWWGICYSWLYQQFDSYKKEKESEFLKEEYNEKNLLHKFLSNCFSKKLIVKVLLNNVAKKSGEIEEKKLKKIDKKFVGEILKKEYKFFINTFLNVVRGFEEIEEIIQI